jgi:hypothetical protein
MPPVQERVGVSESEIVLAFPINNQEPQLEPQQVFAFLPIRPYGFMVSDQAIGRITISDFISFFYKQTFYSSQIEKISTVPRHGT